VQNMVVASADEAWSFGGSIMTFLLPMIVFTLVAAGLLVLYTKPELVPGRPPADGAFPIGATRIPGHAAGDAVAPPAEDVAAPSAGNAAGVAGDGAGDTGNAGNAAGDAGGRGEPASSGQ
jgi:hypothetical protein